MDEKQIKYIIEDLEYRAKEDIELMGDLGKLRPWRDAGMPGECPIDLVKLGYGEIIGEGPDDEQTKTEASDTPVIEPIALPVSQAKADLEPNTVASDQRKELDRLMGQALDEESERKYDEALATLEKLLAIEPGSVEARSLRERVIQKKEKASISRLKVMLEHEVDFGLLNGAVTEAYKLLDRGDAELNRLYELGKARRDKRREEMGQLTTADAMKELVNVQLLIVDAEAAIARGERTFFDARDYQTRDIGEVLEEARAAIPGLVAAFVDKSLERAATFMPSDPKAAQKVLEEALKNKEIAGVPALLKQMEKQEGIYQSEAAKWEKADELLQHSDEPKWNPIERFKLVQNASETYGGHAEVQAKHNATKEGACNYLASKLKDAIIEAERILSHEAQEALRQREVGEVDVNLQAFEQARGAVKAVQAEIQVLPAEAITQTLQVEQANAQAFLEKVKSAEERRADLRVKYQKLEKLLGESKLDQAKADYESLPGNYKVDPELDSLFRTRIEPFFGEEDHWKNAQRLFADGKWGECVATLDHVASTSPLAEPAVDLRMRADLNRLANQIEQAWQKQLYEVAAREIETFVSYRNADHQLRDEISLRLRLTEKQVEINRRRDVNREHNVDIRYNDILSELETFRNLLGTRKVKLDSGQERVRDEWVAQAQALYDNTGELLKLDTTRAGELGAIHKEVKSELHSLAVLRLEALYSNAKVDFKKAFDLVQVLIQRELIFSGHDAELRRQAVIGYYDFLEAERKSTNSLDDLAFIVQNWEKAVSQHKYDLDIRSRLRQARKNYLLAYIEHALKQLDHAKTLGIFEAQEKPCVFDPTVVFEESTLEDQELVRLRQVAESLRDAQRDFENQLYKSAVEVLEVAYQERQHASLKQKRNLLAREAIGLLTRQADEAIQKNDIPLVVQHYAAVLSIDAQNTTAQNQIKHFQQAAEAEITKAIQRVKNYKTSAMRLAKSIAELRNLESRLENLRAACEYLEAGKKSRTQLETALKELHPKIQMLTEAREKLMNLSLFGETWKSACRSGSWEEIQATMVELRNMFGSQGGIPDDLSELSLRVDEYQKRRDDLVSLRGDLEAHFGADEFIETLKTCEKIENLLLKQSRKYLADIRQSFESSLQDKDLDSARQYFLLLSRLSTDAKTEDFGIPMLERFLTEGNIEQIRQGFEKVYAKYLELNIRYDLSFAQLPREYAISDRFSRILVYYFVDKNQSNHSKTLSVLTEQRLKTYQEWKSFTTKFQRRYEKLASDDIDEDAGVRLFVENRLDIELERPSRIMLEKLEIYAFVECSEALKLYDESYPKDSAGKLLEPDSIKTSDLKKECEQMNQILLAIQDAAGGLHRELVRAEQNIQQKLDEVTKLVNERSLHQMALINESLYEIETFYQGSKNPNQEFITHLHNVIRFEEENSQRPARGLFTFGSR